MASGAELPEYSSPAKRRKVALEEYGTAASSELDFRDCKETRETSQENLEGISPKICQICRKIFFISRWRRCNDNAHYKRDA